jgi:hypothetical protein
VYDVVDDESLNQTLRHLTASVCDNPKLYL